MTTSNDQTFRVTYSRVQYVVMAAGFLLALAGALDFKFIHHLHWKIKDTSPLISWAVLAFTALTAFYCTVKSLFPDLIFDADPSGLRIGSTPLRVGQQTISWADVSDIAPGELRRYVGTSPGHFATFPALVFTFSENIDLGTVGDPTISPDHNKLRIDAGMLPVSLTEAVDRLASIRSSALSLH